MVRSRYTKKRYGPYWASLGEFAYYFAKLEYAVLRTLVIYTQTPEKTAKAIFSGTRTRDAMSFVRRTSMERGEPLADAIDKTFAKIASINTERDRILHHGIEIGDDETAFVSDENRNLTSKGRREPISIADMEALISDTVTCWAKIVVYNQSMLEGPHLYQRDWETRAQRPWLYKLPQPSQAKLPRQPKRKQSPRLQS